MGYLNTESSKSKCSEIIPALNKISLRVIGNVVSHYKNEYSMLLVDANLMYNIHFFLSSPSSNTLILKDVLWILGNLICACSKEEMNIELILTYEGLMREVIRILRS